MLKLNHLTGFGSGVAGAAAGTPTSYVLDGTGDCLSIADHADLDFGAGSFTLDFWMYRAAGFGTTQGVITARESGIGAGADVGWLCNINSSNIIEFYNVSTGGVNGNMAVSASIAGMENQWIHVACEKDGNTTTIYVNGIASGSTADVTGESFDAGGTSGLVIGRQESDGDYTYFSGYLDEVRLSDVARYSGNFTPETSQYISDANTKLLIHGGEAYTAPLTGETTAPCYVFDGTSDQLSLPDHADWDLFADTNNATIDLWVNFSATNGKDFIGQYEGAQEFWRIYTTIGTLKFDLFDGSQVFQCADTHTFVADTWHHVALCKVGIEYGLYIDGTQIAYVSDAGTATFTGGLFFGGHTHVGGDWYDGKMAEMRIYDGNPFTAAPNVTPDDTIIVPTERHTSDANTLLLIHGDEGSGIAAFTDSGNTGHTVTTVNNAFLGNGGTFTDSGNTGHTVTENGQAQRETEQEFKFADDGVGYFLDGNGDYLSIPDHADWDLTSDFTIEFFAYTNDRSRSLTAFVWNQYEDAQNRVDFRLDESGLWYWRVEEANVVTVNVSSSAAFTDFNWHHVALVRENDNYYIYIDGVNRTSSGSPDSSTPPTLAGPVYIGHLNSNTHYFPGYLDEIRVSDTCRYPSGTGFTPTSTQFVSDANTLLLIHGGEAKSGTTGSGATFTDSGNTGHTVTENGNAIESTGNFYKF
jgi:hypothetical protein